MYRYHSYFHVYEDHESLHIRLPQQQYFEHVHIYLDDQPVMRTRSIDHVVLNKQHIPSGAHVLHMAGWMPGHDRQEHIQEHYLFSIRNAKPLRMLERDDFKTGDILIASDNVNGLPTGYMGHAVLVIDGETMLESTNKTESIRIQSLRNFFNNHERYAHFRPTDEEMGKAAVQWGLAYHEQYQDNLEQGHNRPRFSFVPTTDITEIWDTIYCSKLVWFCYYFGTGHEIPMHGLWMSPQNLNDELEKDPYFEQIYQHPDHGFKIVL